MTATLESLITPTTRDQVLADMIAIGVALGVPMTSWQQGSAALATLTILAQAIANSQTVIAALAKGGYLYLAEGDWLTLLAANLYSVDRLPASSAAGTLTITNGSAVDYGTIAAGEFLVANAVTGVIYANSASFALGPSTSVDVDFVSQSTGAASSATSGQVTEVVQPLSGVTCTNTDAWVGTDAESDADLRDRCIAKQSALAPTGTEGAYQYVAASAVREDGTPIGVTRTKVTADTMTGFVTVLVATASGAVTGSTGTPGTDLYIVNEDIQTQAVPACVTATVDSATTLSIDIDAIVNMLPGATQTEAEIEDNISAALVSYFSSVDIGGVIGYGAVPISAIISAIFNANTQTADVQMNDPTVDVTIAADEVPILGALSLTINYL